MRPHDIVLERDRVAALAADARTAGSPGVVEAAVERVVRLGFEVRVELRADSGERFAAQVTRAEADRQRFVPGRDRLRPAARAGRAGWALDAESAALAHLQPVRHELCGVDISARTEYAVRAMLALAQAQADGAGPLSVDALAQRQDLPRKFLEAIVADLRGAGPGREHPRGPRRLHPGAAGIRGQSR